MLETSQVAAAGRCLLPAALARRAGSGGACAFVFVYVCVRARAGVCIVKAVRVRVALCASGRTQRVPGGAQQNGPRRLHKNPVGLLLWKR